MICNKCGKEYLNNETYCKNCGNQLIVQPQTSGNQNVQENDITNTKLNMQYASTKDRILSFLKDYLIIIGISFLIFMIITIITFTSNVMSVSNGGATIEQSPILSTIQIIVPIFLIIFGWPIKYLIDSMSETHTSKYLRKRGYIILNEDGSNLTSGQAIGRAIIVFLVYNLGLILISLITIIATDKKQGIQDLILKQVIVKKQ